MSGELPKHVNCPKCERRLAQAGELTTNGQVMAVFQCDECLSFWELDGERIETALTFAVAADGKTFVDPETLKPIHFTND